MVGERYGKLVVIEEYILELKKKEQRNARMTIKVL